MPPRAASPLPLLLAVIVLLLAVVGGGVLLVISRPAPVTMTIHPPPATATAEPITIYVTGAVNQPGSLVTLPRGSRVSDAVQGAGGAAAHADLQRMDMAAPLRDGDTVHVYALGEATPTVQEQSAGAPAVVYVNRATLAELETLPGVGAALAQRILDYRAANGAFTSLEDLGEVSGIGERTLEALAPLVSFD